MALVRRWVIGASHTAMRAGMHPGIVAGTLALCVATTGCEPLYRQPEKPDIGVAIISPKDGSSLIQPGPQVEFVVELKRCKQLRGLQLFNHEKMVVNVPADQLDQRPVAFQVDLNTLLTATDWKYDYEEGRPQALSLLAHADCAD